jgi:hypothetical protein
VNTCARWNAINALTNDTMPKISHRHLFRIIKPPNKIIGTTDPYI